MKILSLSVLIVVALCPFARAEWAFSDGDTPNAFLQADNKSLELQCDRIRFSPSSYEDSLDIVSLQALSLRFMQNASTEAGVFQASQENATLKIVENYPVEILFQDTADHDFVLDQIARNAILGLSRASGDKTYGQFDLTGSSAAIRSMRSACKSEARATPVTRVPEGIIYCGGGEIKRRIEYVIRDDSDGPWDAIVTVNGEQIPAMTAYSYFGNSKPPAGFVVALLGKDRSEFLVFRQGRENWLEYGDYRYDQCN